MADDKNGRENQADDEQQRQRERAVEEALVRGDEEEPPDPEPAARPEDSDVETRRAGALSEDVGLDSDDPGRQLGDLDEALTNLEYPATGEDVVAALGDREVESQDGLQSVEEVFAPVEGERFDSPDQVRERLLGLLRRQ